MNKENEKAKPQKSKKLRSGYNPTKKMTNNSLKTMQTTNRYNQSNIQRFPQTASLNTRTNKQEKTTRI